MVVHLAIPSQKGHIRQMTHIRGFDIKRILQHHSPNELSKADGHEGSSVSPGADLQPVKSAPHADGLWQHFWQDPVHQGTSTLSLADVLRAALDDLTGALERFPDNARLLTSAAVLHGRQGRVEHARELFRQGQAIDPRNAVLLRVRLQTYFHTGKEVENWIPLGCVQCRASTPLALPLSA